MGQEHAGAIAPSWRDYLEMCKPRVVMLMLVTAAAGMLLAVPPGAGLPAADLVLATLTGIALVAGSAAVINHVADAHIDARMLRTRRRPMVRGGITPPKAMLFSAALALLGMSLLTFAVNPATAWLNLLSWAGYGIVYTLYLKHMTPQNIVIGGLFGAAPPLFGWTAVTGGIAVEPLVLVAIIFVWTPPHFWALALDRIDEYADAGVPMLPVTHGDAHTRRQVFGYTVLLTAVSLLPGLLGTSGVVYVAAAVVLNAVFLYRAVTLLLRRPGAEIRTFRYSIAYLGLLFTALLTDHYLEAVL
ncbi:MAG: protoheme IX farnesyltransferase [Gammaproteobacteria bacterium]|nr:protoheme IX farnesyltransferase [Gammaproteobacteria bacterium]MBK81601.1 protoheme IX farnesyltransferase [Gammaproteobacteria bacterium]|tara:strand:+ start:5193 stop:6095 length:903 start_codon:yes stop_codon:yes gene_type:complete